MSDIEQYVQKIKELEKKMLELLEDSSKLNADGRWKSIAKTHFQEGRMAAVRSVYENISDK